MSGSAAQPGEEKKASEKELKAPEGKVQLLFCTAHALLQDGGCRGVSAAGKGRGGGSCRPAVLPRKVARPMRTEERDDELRNRTFSCIVER
jgi:hypothetical protein